MNEALSTATSAPAVKPGADTLLTDQRTEYYPPITLVVLAGGWGESEPEQMLARACKAAILDLLELAFASPFVERAVLGVDDPAFAEQVGALFPRQVAVELTERPFYFGRTLLDVLQRHEIERPLYFGAGSGALLTAQELDEACRALVQSEFAVVTNNLYSCDFLGWVPAQALTQIELPEHRDNNLAWLLRRQAGLPVTVLPRSPGTMLDLDTPTDLMVLALHPQARRHVLAALGEMDLDTSRLRATFDVVTDPMCDILVAGRVNSYVWQHLETDVAARVRVLSEERGMEASGRHERGEVRSLLGYHLEAVGPERLFEELATLCQAAFIDSRVLFHHLRLHVSPADRFYSDLGRPDLIADPYVARFTRAALEAPIPVILGGHSLVTGGLWALVDAAWQERDARLGRFQYASGPAGTPA